MSDENLYATFHQAARTFPEHDAVVFEECALSYGELDQLVLSIATGLDHLGVGPGDRVLVYAPNSPEVLATCLACAYLGAIFAPVNPVYRAHEMNYVCANAQARVAIVHAEKLDDFDTFGAAASHTPEATVVVGEPDGRAFSGKRIPFKSLVSDRRPPRQHSTIPTDPVVICYTSGTTATPKPVLHSHASEVYCATTYAGIWNLSPEDRAVVSMPIAWSYGLETTSMSLLSAGASVLLCRRFHPVKVLEEIEARRATIFYGTMSMYMKMLDVLSRQRHDLSSLRICLNGGEACPDGAVREFEQATGLRLIQAYAASEARPLLAVRPDDVEAPFNTSGRLVPKAKLRLLDELGAEVNVGEVGEAEAWCPGMMLGYWHEPGLTANKLTADGWLKTGDLLLEDERGYFRVVGRRSDMIIRSGANVAPAEVESAIVGHPAVAAVGVVGVPDPLSGEAVVAIIVPVANEIVDRADLQAHLADILAPYKLPSHIILAEELPLNASGKADRGALRERALVLLAADEARSAP
jgi:acyl-CoA synthetase (AMP-forming)/AMP-acid ligase II